jgi:hypothetical protein
MHIFWELSLNINISVNNYIGDIAFMVLSVVLWKNRSISEVAVDIQAF